MPPTSQSLRNIQLPKHLMLLQACIKLLTSLPRTTYCKRVAIGDCHGRNVRATFRRSRRLKDGSEFVLVSTLFWFIGSS